MMKALVHSWRLWMVIAYFGLLLVVVGLYTQSRKINATEREHVKIEAIQQADANGRVSRCLASRAAIRRFDMFVTAVLLLHRSLAENAKAAVEATPKSDPIHALRVRAYQRLASTLEPIERARFPIPSVESCRALR